MSVDAPRTDPLLADVLKAAVGIAGLALCITLVFLAMRAVMDVGGACADGGPYVSAQSCPEGSSIALLGGVFGLFVFGAIATVYGVRIGGIWAAAPLLAWSGLFLSLGWNFLDYGLFNAPPEAGIVWGWVVCGVMFMVMGGAPLVFGLAAFGAAPIARRGASGSTSLAESAPLGASRPSASAAGPSGAAGAYPASSPVDDDLREVELRAIAADMGAAVVDAQAETPADPLARVGEVAGSAAAAPAPGFSEGTQALLDRLERLADLRDRGLLGADEYETAKDAIVRELEERS